MLVVLPNFYKYKKQSRIVETLESTCVFLFMLCFFYRFCIPAEVLKMEVVGVTNVESLSKK